MKTKLLLFLFLGSIISYGQQVTTLPAYESFDYAEGTKLIEDDATIGVGFWSTTGPRAGDILTVASPTWSSISGIETPTGNAINFAGSGLKAEYLFTPQTGTFGKIYASFLMKVTDVTTLDATASRFFGFGKLNSGGTVSGTTHVFVRKDVGNVGFNLGVNESNSSTGVLWDTTVYTIDTEMMIVIYHDDTNSASNSKIWINPVINGTEPAALLEDGPRALDVDRIQIYQHSSTNTPNMIFDEMRIGKTWQEVTKPSSLSVEKETLINVNIYPNPVNYQKELYVNTQTLNEKEITIYNLLGKEVLRKKVLSAPINVSNLTSGIYLLTLKEDGDFASKKLIIK